MTGGTPIESLIHQIMKVTTKQEITTIGPSSRNLCPQTSKRTTLRNKLLTTGITIDSHFLAIIRVAIKKAFKTTGVMLRSQCLDFIRLITKIRKAISGTTTEQ